MSDALLFIRGCSGNSSSTCALDVIKSEPVMKYSDGIKVLLITSNYIFTSCGNKVIVYSVKDLTVQLTYDFGSPIEGFYVGRDMIVVQLNDPQGQRCEVEALLPYRPDISVDQSWQKKTSSVLVYIGTTITVIATIFRLYYCQKNMKGGMDVKETYNLFKKTADPQELIEEATNGTEKKFIKVYMYIHWLGRFISVLLAIALCYLGSVTLQKAQQKANTISDILLPRNIPAFRDKYFVDCDPQPNIARNLYEFCYCTDDKLPPVSPSPCKASTCGAQYASSCASVAENQCVCDASFYQSSCGKCDYSTETCSKTTQSFDKNVINPDVLAAFNNCTQIYTRSVHVLDIILYSHIVSVIVTSIPLLPYYKDIVVKKMKIKFPFPILIQLLISVAGLWVLSSVKYDKAMCATHNGKGILDPNVNLFQGCRFIQDMSEFEQVEREGMATITTALFVAENLNYYGFAGSVLHYSLDFTQKCGY
jgi:hypothetical protein